MPGLDTTRSKSLFGLAHIRNQFYYSRDYDAAKQDVINRIASVNLPPGVNPQISPASPIGEIMRFTLENPIDPATKQPIYTLNDLKALQDFVVARELSRVPRIAGVTTFGGTIKRYEVHPDPDRLRQYGIQLSQLQTALGNANMNGSGDNLTLSQQTFVVRSLGLFGYGEDPQQQVLGMTDPVQAAQFLRDEEASRCQQIRQVVVNSVNNVPVRVDQLVDGGPLLNADGSARVDNKTLIKRGVVIGYQTRQGRVGMSRSLRARAWDQLSDQERDEIRGRHSWLAPPKTRWNQLRDFLGIAKPEPGNPERFVWFKDELLDWQSRPAGARRWGELSPQQQADVRNQLATRLPQDEKALSGWKFFVNGANWDGWQDERWVDDDDVVQGIVLLRKGQESLPALHDLQQKVDELNEPGNLLPGVKIVPYYNRTELIHRTTTTVYENLLMGMSLVTIILLMFLSNIRAALIVAINIPLALLFAFGVLYARNRSANLLSIGAVDFGIIVDSSVIIVESIYRYLANGHHAGRPLGERIAAACGEVSKSMFFATAIMICALLPLFTMKGPEGQIFSPMADTYAFALAGALLLAMVVSPVLCLIFLKRLKPQRENFLVRGLEWIFVSQLRIALRFRLVGIGLFVLLLVITGVIAGNMGQEFMPELEEGNVFIRGTFPVSVSLNEVAERSRKFRQLLQEFPEFYVIVPAIGRPDDGTDPTGYYNMEANVPLRPERDWPIVPKLGRPRTKPELVRELNDMLADHFPGVDWDISQIIRDNVMEALSGVKGDNSIKIFGPDLDRLEDLAQKTRDKLSGVPGREEGVAGIENPGVFRIQGQSNLEFPVDLQKCARWNVSAADVQAIIQSAVAGKPVSQMREGAKIFDITTRWPERLRWDDQAIMDIPVPVNNNQVTAGNQASLPATPTSSGGTGLSPIGTISPLPVRTGSQMDVPQITPLAPVRRLGDLVTPRQRAGTLSKRPSIVQPGASTIYREQGQRFIALKFEVRDRDLASTVNEARERVAPLLQPPYRAEWSGEFQEMEDATNRMARVFLLSLALIAVLLYLAFNSVLDALVVFANVLVMAVGGVLALKITGLNFNISAAVGFISILGVAAMNGLLLVSGFNALRAKGVDLHTALIEGTSKRVRPLMMTTLTAILGLLPAALSTKIGSQSQRPLAVVVVGGMLFTMVALNLVPVLYSLYGHRQPPKGAGDIAH
jgi:cobalt-zinc-cadmium resistance protein CzcA